MRPDRRESQSYTKPVEKLANPKHIDNNKRVIIIIRPIKILCLQVMVLSFMKFDFLLPGGEAAAAGYLGLRVQTNSRKRKPWKGPPKVCRNCRRSGLPQPAVGRRSAVGGWLSKKGVLLFRLETGTSPTLFDTVFLRYRPSRN